MIDQKERMENRDPSTKQESADALGSILISGSSGLVGQALMKRLAEGSRIVQRLVRSRVTGSDVLWDTSTGALTGSLDTVDSVIHLAGESIAEGRWTDSKMAAIRDSRVQATRMLSESLAKLESPPSVLVCASAIGYYGHRGDEVLTEESGRGSGFLADVCDDWESATQPARDAGIRVVHVRIGVVLASEGGALSKMLLPFKLGLGGVIGNGQQFMSWIHIEDLVSVLCQVAEDERYSGAVNGTAPKPVTNREFTKTLGKVLKRPTIAPMPGFAARLAFGKMGDELLLSSIRAEPHGLLDSGFRFEHPELEGALRSVLNS